MVTVTLVTVPWPATVMFDGYGVAGPLSGMVMAVGLVKTAGVHAGVGVTVGVAVGVGVGQPAPDGRKSYNTGNPLASVFLATR